MADLLSERGDFEGSRLPWWNIRIQWIYPSQNHRDRVNRRSQANGLENCCGLSIGQARRMDEKRETKE